MRYTNPFDEVLNELIEYWDPQGETFERICRTIFDVSEYTSYLEIAEEADCAGNSVKKHLDRLAMLGVVDKDPRTDLARYRRNSAYIEWRVLRYIVEEYPMEEIIERVEALESRQEDLMGQTGAVPSIVQATDVKQHESVGPQMKAANELEAIKRRIRLYELARQTLENNEHLISGGFQGHR